MRFEVEGICKASPDETMRVYHASLETLGARLPNVERVEVLERTSERTRLRWFAVGDIPRAARRFLKPEDLFWEDEVAWDVSERTARVRIHRPGFDFVRCDSTLRFQPIDGDATRVVCEGDLHIGVPLVGAFIERAFVGHAADNMRRFFALLADDLAPKEVPP